MACQWVLSRECSLALFASVWPAPGVYGVLTVNWVQPIIAQVYYIRLRSCLWTMRKFWWREVGFRGKYPQMFSFGEGLLAESALHCFVGSAMRTARLVFFLKLSLVEPCYQACLVGWLKGREILGSVLDEVDAQQSIPAFRSYRGYEYFSVIF
jgi:hypothetical protein